MAQLAAKRFIETSHKKFQMVNIKALHAAGLAAFDKMA